MREIAERFDLEPAVEVEFTPLQGADIRILVHRVDVGDAVVLFGTTSVEDFADAAARGAFHLDDETAFPGWDDAAPVDVVLALRRPLTGLFGSGDDIIEGLFADAPTVLRNSESWWALEATQEIGVPDVADATSSFGLRTRWADLT